jgi:glycosyltransferase involved in cell wall biosynthesis
MLVGHRTSDDPDVDTVHGSDALRRLDRLANIAGAATGLQYLYLPSSHRVWRHPWVADADVIQLYNTHGGYFSQWLIPALASRAPLVWRMSDLWLMTGHCAYPGSCERWRIGCGACPDLGTYPGLKWDTTGFLWRHKQKLYARSKMTIVAPSSWAGRMARESPILGGFPVHQIPNGIDAALFYPQDKIRLRQKLGIPVDAKVILFAAHILDDNPRKGGELLISALAHVGARPGVRLMLVGRGGSSWPSRVPIPVDCLGFIVGAELAAAYAAADIFVAPSAVENLPNTVLEAMAAGLPVVASNAGGMADAVRHNETGLLFDVGDAGALAKNLECLFDDADLQERLGQAARRVIKEEFSEEAEVQRFAELYVALATPRTA